MWREKVEIVDFYTKTRVCWENNYKKKTCRINLISENRVMLSQTVLLQLKELTDESDYDLSIQKLIKGYIESRLEYYKLVDKQFEEKKGMPFQEYQDTKYEEWDGTNWNLKSEFHDWEAAVSSLQYFSDLKEKWSLVSSK